MGKNKNKEKKSNKKFIENDEEETSEFEKLKRFAEKTGRNIWEVSMLDLEKENIEEEELLSDQELEKEELNEEPVENTNECNNIIKEVNKDSLEDTINNEIEKIISSNNDKEKDVINNINNDNPDILEETIDLQLDKLEIKSTAIKKEEYPLYFKINNEITKIIHLESENDQSVENSKNGGMNVKFGNTKVIFEFPKEDINTKPNKNKNKKVSESEPPILIDKKDKKKKNNDLTEITEEDLLRLEEAKRKREEFAYLEKCRIEEEELRKEENSQKLLEESKKQKDKNKYKPKPKKKKGK